MNPLWRWTIVPLRIGTAIYNDVRNETGSIGGFAADASGEVWLVSCGHVLTAPGAVPANGDILLPDGQVIASAVGMKWDVGLDVAAVRLQPGVKWSQSIVGLGIPVGSPIEPVDRMNVCKVGAETVLTEGRITQVNPTEFIITPGEGFPADYELSAKGDSGALWIERDSRRPVGIHRRGSTGQGNYAAAVPLRAALGALGLNW